jgi:catechol 2,3-dioxygenase-like lactoylglutathione lyase family enzyme
MNYVGPCIAVNDIKESRDFYENLLGQKVKYNFGENISYEGTFAIQLKPHFARMIHLNEDDLTAGSNNFEIAMETEDLDGFIKNLKGSRFKVEFLHDTVEHAWGQRVVRFYDPSRNIIEVGETMKVVCLRYLNQGLSLEETAAKTQHPLEFVKQCRKEKVYE